MNIGGTVVVMPAKGTGCLVIGEFYSPDWVHTTFDRSVERAVEFQELWQDLKIISERYWVDAMAVHG